MYYPKSQIIENLYTNGGELKPYNSKDEYKGYYFKTSTGEFFTGKNPKDKPNTPLELIDPLGNELSSPSSKINNKQNKKNPKKYTSKESEPLATNHYIINDAYYNAKSIPINRGEAPRKPISSVNYPTDDDYKLGKYTRYFVKKSNQNHFIEINKDEYNLFKEKNNTVQHTLYIPFSFPWQLTGNKEEVFNINKSLSFLYENEKQLYGLNLFFKNRFDKYYKPFGE